MDDLDPESYLDKDFNELQSEIDEKADELSNVNIEDYKSVAIWCEKFNATFGAARLQAPS